MPRTAQRAGRTARAGEPSPQRGLLEQVLADIERRLTELRPHVEEYLLLQTARERLDRIIASGNGRRSSRRTGLSADSRGRSEKRRGLRLSDKTTLSQVLSSADLDLTDKQYASLKR